MRTRALRLGMPPVVALAMLAAAPSPAVAEDRPLETLGEGQLDIWIYSDRFKFCGIGSANSTAQIYGQWSLRISGLRGSEVYVHPAWTSSALTVNHCETVYRNGATTGHLEADFGYVGAYGYFFVHSAGGVTWDPSTGPRVHGADLTPY